MIHFNGLNLLLSCSVAFCLGCCCVQEKILKLLPDRQYVQLLVAIQYLDNIVYFTCTLFITFDIASPAVVGLIQFTQEPSSMIARLSESIWWHCTARLVGSNTALSYSWFKGDQPIIINSNTELFQNGTFHIREVRRVDSGSYHCRAQGGGEIAYSESSTLSIAGMSI